MLDMINQKKYVIKENLKFPTDIANLKFDIIVADPPYHFSGGKKRTNPANHYEVMKDVEMIDFFNDFPKNKIADNALFFLWVTDPKLYMLMPIINTMGFKYAGGGFDWIKLNKGFRKKFNDNKLMPMMTEEEILNTMYAMSFMGTGYRTRKNKESCYISVKGSYPRPDEKGVPALIFAPRGKHSAKPDEYKRRIRVMYPDAKVLELFAVGTAYDENWHVWGNEAEDGIELHV